MPKRVALSSLNANTIDIMNVIRENGSYNYQSLVPTVSTAQDIPVVGDVIYGTPALANEFINALMNMIALVRIKSVTFNNPYRDLKKGYVDYGETIEEIFVDLAKVRLFNKEKVDSYEFKRTVPDVKTAFHVINWRVQYPITIEDEELRMAFRSADGVTDLIAKIVDSVYRAAEYDEFLLFKYMLIKGYNKGDIAKVTTVGAGATPTLAEYAAEFRGISNEMLFLTDKYNSYPVMNNTPRDRQRIFMGARFNAQFDVSVLASAFNMEKANFMGQLTLIDSFDTFDNARFAAIRAESDAVEEVTSTELTAMQSVKAMIIDEEWFQVYDNLARMTEKYASSGLYWNYFYNTWKTVSWSPFANAVAIL